MVRAVDPRDRPGWQPATSEPGEVYTAEGRIAAAGVFARGLRRRDPRGAAYRRSMARTGLWFVATAVALAAVLIVVT